MFKIVDVPVIKGKKQRTSWQRRVQEQIAYVDEVKARANEVAQLRVELLSCYAEAVAVTGMNPVVAQDTQRRAPKGKMVETTQSPSVPAIYDGGRWDTPI